ncbi:MAG: Diaminopimelate decarboxylase [Fimbriimonadaceae bacterium]|nr:Diaminopimelate decarboxylase [Fimbriimonadaceae bacterium]
MSVAESLDTRFKLSSQQAADLASRFGTPLYVIDAPSLKRRIRAYRDAFAGLWPKTELSYASKANSTLAILRIACNEGLMIDVASEGELRAALAAGVPANRCHFHGNNKQRSELEFALQVGVGQIVADSLLELAMLDDLGCRLPVSLRLAPGVDPITHEKISTGQADTKFGFGIVGGHAEEAVNVALDHRLDLAGFHCHVGSQLLDPLAQISGGVAVAEFGVAMAKRHGFELRYVNTGGGLGVRYTDGDQPMEISDYNRALVEALKAVLDPVGVTPTLGQEPGRSLIAEAGVTLYRVGPIKDVTLANGDSKRFVAVDGGLSDNPRPALYGSRYTVLAFRDGPSTTVTVSGKHCETDQLFPNLQLPENLRSGDLLQVLCTGAYNAAMANNYNRYPRPAAVVLDDIGEPHIAQKRETWDQLFEREVLPEGL